MPSSVGALALVLHAHQPFVLGHGRWPHGSDRLCEAIVESYLPLIRTIRMLITQETSPQLTLSLSPVLCEQLSSPHVQQEIQDYLDTRLRACADTAADCRNKNDPELAELATYWEHFYHEAQSTLESISGDILGAFRRLMEEGHLELITSAATHGYLPLLGREESVRLQLRVAIVAHETHFGQRPRGVWLPECGYRPRYHWLPPVGTNRGQRRTLRRGLEEHLAACGLTYFCTDSQLALGGTALPPYEHYFPQLAALRDIRRGEWPIQHGISPYVPCRVTSRGGAGAATALIRDQDSSRAVWSRESGYSGNAWYLEFHKKYSPSGLKLWRVSENANLTAKSAYSPQHAQAQAHTHAGHFASLITGQLNQYHSDTNSSGLVCAPYLAELFGHWWHEGLHWLGALYQELRQQGVEVMRCSTALDQHAPSNTTNLSEGSWGEGGDHRTWLNNDTAWTWERLYDCEDEFWAFVKDHPTAIDTQLGRVVCQAARELLLMQSSDWTFLMTAQTARDYAEQRYLGHYTDLKRLLQLARQITDQGSLSTNELHYLEDREQQNCIFPKLEQALFR